MSYNSIVNILNWLKKIVDKLWIGFLVEDGEREREEKGEGN